MMRAPRRIESLKIANSPQRRAKWNFARQFGGKTNRIMSGASRVTRGR